MRLRSISCMSTSIYSPFDTLALHFVLKSCTSPSTNGSSRSRFQTCRRTANSQCYTLPKRRSFAIHFFDFTDHYMMFYSLSSSCDSVVLEKCVPLDFTHTHTAVLLAPDRESVYLASDERKDIKVLSMNDGDSEEIGRFLKWPKHWMLYEHTIYALYVEMRRKLLRLCAFEVQRGQWGDEQWTHHIDVSQWTDRFLDLRNLLLVCYLRYIDVLDVVTGCWRCVDIGHLAPLTAAVHSSDERLSSYMQMLDNGELMLFSGRASANKRETRLRVLVAFQPQSLTDIALRAVHESMPAETRTALGASPLGDTTRLVSNLFTLTEKC